MGEPVLYAVDGRLAPLRFNRPERLSAVDLATADAFAVCVERALGDPAADRAKGSEIHLAEHARDRLPGWA